MYRTTILALFACLNTVHASDDIENMLDDLNLSTSSHPSLGLDRSLSKSGSSLSGSGGSRGSLKTSQDGDSLLSLNKNFGNTQAGEPVASLSLSAAAVSSSEFNPYPAGRQQIRSRWPAPSLSSAATAASPIPVPVSQTSLSYDPFEYDPLVGTPPETLVPWDLSVRYPVAEDRVISLACIDIEMKSYNESCKTLVSAIDRAKSILLENGISLATVEWKLDVDGTLTTHGDPNKPAPWPFGQREDSVSLVRDLKMNGGKVKFSSAYVDPQFNGEEIGFRATIDRLKRLGFSDADLDIETGAVVEKMSLHLQTQLRGTVPLIAYKFGSVVSCKSPSATDGYFRGKFFAGGIARQNQDLCSEVKAVVLIDDSKTNIDAFLEDSRRYNLYGQNTILFITMYLAPYKPTI